MFLEVASIAGTLSVSAESGVIVKLFPEFNLGNGHRVVRRNLHRLISRKLRPHRFRFRFHRRLSSASKKDERQNKCQGA
jgi:hypothetical protein